MTSVTPTLEKLTMEDIDAVIRLGREIWLGHYVDIIGREQVDYMIEQRFTPERLHQYIDAPDRWWCVLKLRSEAIGFCSYAYMSMRGELKLEQLYLRLNLRGQGYGTLMMQHVERHARELGGDTVILQVNKHNSDAIEVYKKSGYSIREAAVFPIGGGFVMDDYVMEKQLAQT